MAEILNGKELSKKVEVELRKRVEVLVERLGFKPVLSTILVGDNPASVTYVKMKVTYFVDGAELGNVPLGEDFEGVAGFRMTVESMNGGANYLFDRMLIVNFPERGGKVDLPDVAVIEKAPKVEGRSMTMFLTEKRS